MIVCAYDVKSVVCTLCICGHVAYNNRGSNKAVFEGREGQMREFWCSKCGAVTYQLVPRD